MRVHGADEDSYSQASPEPFVHPDDCKCHACRHKTVYDKQKGQIASEDSVKEGDQLTVVGSNASTAVTGHVGKPVADASSNTSDAERKRSLFRDEVRRLAIEDFRQDVKEVFGRDAKKHKVD